MAFLRSAGGWKEGKGEKDPSACEKMNGAMLALEQRVSRA